MEMMDEFIGAYGNKLIVAVVGVGLALLVLAIVLWIIRRRGGSSPFIRGGRNRQPRLQVLDATAVDARRRLVLVRRDNVEHLVMIGGPTDIVIESGIGAIPIMTDIRDQQPEIPQLPQEQTRRLAAAAPENNRATIPMAAPASAPQPETVRTEAPAPAIRQAAPAPRPPAPVTAPTRPMSAPQAAVAPPPVSPPTVSAEPPPAARPVTREPVPPVIPTPPVVAAVVTAPVATAAPSQAPVVKVTETAALQPPAVTAPPVRPQPSANNEPSFDRDNAGDFLDAARDRVLPNFRPAPPVGVTVAAAKPEPVSPKDEAEPRFNEELTSDFESFLEAEIAKTRDGEAPSVTTEALSQPQRLQPVSPPISGASPDGDAQKEMARIFGEMSVTRDK